MQRRLLGAAIGFALLSSFAAEPPWAVPDAPLRAFVRPKTPPNDVQAGWLIELPELGHTMPKMEDVVLADDRGAILPLAKVFRGEGQRVLLLAQSMPAEGCIYFGGKRIRRAMPWQPKTSLLLETRRLRAGAKLDDWQALESAWKKATAVDGAGFVETVAHGVNPFGESADFLSRYTGWLKTGEKKLSLYTLSSDASFVLVNGRFEFGWPGQHPPHADEKSVPKKDVSTLGGLTQVEYYHAKLGDSAPAMVLGWMRGGKPETIPPQAWAHPGVTEIVRMEHVQAGVLPVPSWTLQSYFGWSGLWLYEARCILKPEPPPGVTAEWQWSDGATFSGNACDRVLVGPAPVQVSVRLKSREKGSGIGLLTKITFGGLPPPAASTENAAELKRYLALFDREDPARLAAETLKAGVQFLSEFGNDQQLGKWASAWLAKNPGIDDPLWIKGQLARLRALAQTNPQQALSEVRKFDTATRRRYARELALFELELLVFHLKDPAGLEIAKRIAFENASNDLGRLAKVRAGDLYRLLGRGKEAVEQYRSVQKTLDDETKGRKFAAQDRSYSITISDMIEQGHRHEAMAKLAEWELEHPMTKFESDFLLLRGRLLMLFGRWNEALQEIESFSQMNPDSPYQIPADFYRARALLELGKHAEAKKIWAEIARKYPKHELAPESAKLAGQS